MTLMMECKKHKWKKLKATREGEKIDIGLSQCEYCTRIKKIKGDKDEITSK